MKRKYICPCPCGEPAVDYSKGCYRCAQCRDIENHLERQIPKAFAGTRQHSGRGVGSAHKAWENYHGDLTPIAGGSLITLDQWLKLCTKKAA